MLEGVHISNALVEMLRKMWGLISIKDPLKYLYNT